MRLWDEEIKSLVENSSTLDLCMQIQISYIIYEISWNEYSLEWVQHLNSINKKKNGK